jgi:hypothetical protein
LCAHRRGRLDRHGTSDLLVILAMTQGTTTGGVALMVASTRARAPAGGCRGWRDGLGLVDHLLGS